MIRLLKLPIFVLFLCAGILQAQSVQKFGHIGDLRLENGSVIRDCVVGYRTYGDLNKAKSNAVLFPTWFLGNTAELAGLVGPGNMADSTKYFVICVDALGDGVSSSPSNSKLQPGLSFPKFNIRDMVNSQYELVTQVLHLNHLYCVIGGSMGGMQTFQWIVSHPDFMDKAVPWVGSPKLTFYDLLLWNTELQIINSNLKADVPVDEIIRSLADITELNIRTPDYYVAHMKPEDFRSEMEKYQQSMAHIFNIYDWRAQLEAMIDHNVAAPFGDNMDSAAAQVKARVLIIVNRQDHMVNPHPAMEFAKLIHAETLILDNSCGHLGPGCEADRVNKAINEFLDKK